MELIRVSGAPDGTVANAGSYVPALSSDGQVVAYYSGASNLVAGDTNGVWDVFVTDMQSSATIRASVAADGTQANGYSDGVSMSADGRYVAFHSRASNLITGDTNDAWDIYVKNLQTGAVARASTAADGTQANGASDGAEISADGRYVAFYSYATNLVTGDTNGQPDIFLKDLQSSAITRVSVTSGGVQANGYSDGASLSGDGRVVAFTSGATNLVADDTNGTYDIFVKDLLGNTMIRASTAADGTQANGDCYLASVSANGRYVAFVSAASNLVADDTNGVWDVFVKDLLTNEIVRASTAADGSQANAFSTSPSISADGRFVTFYSAASNLVAGDVGGQVDVFVKDLSACAITRVSVGLDGAEANGTSYSGAVSADGTFVALHSDASNLVVGDTNGVRDVFRVALLSPGVIEGDDNNNVLNGGAGDETFLGHGGNDSIDAAGGNDSLDGGLGNDDLEGRSGDDVFSGGDGDDTMDGDVGNDTMDGGSGNDEFLGWTGNDSIVAGDGDDFLIGEGENDTLLGGAGNDTLGGAAYSDVAGEDGNDSLDGGAGDDSLDGWTGDDTLFGSDGNDDLEGRSGDDVFSGGDGDDTMDGDVGNDTMDGGSGNDEFLGWTGNDSIVGGDGDDFLIGEGDDDTLLGGAGNDTLGGAAYSDVAGEDRDDSLDGGPGDDRLDGWTGDDTLVGDDGNDIIDGGDNDDFVAGGAGDDDLRGGSGDDYLNGGDGADVFDGGDGNDTLDAWAGEDTLYAGLGNDVLYGGDGNDILNGDDGDDFFLDFYGNNAFDGGNGNDSIYGGDGNDTAAGALGIDSIDGGGGNDSLSGGKYSDVIDGGIGDDTQIGGEASDTLRGDNGADSIVGGLGGDAIDGGDGNDILRGGNAADTILGGGGDDSILGDDAVDLLLGSFGNDTLRGGLGGDTIEGGEGNDLLVGSEGRDLLVGGDGDDRFVYTAVISDSSPAGRDTIFGIDGIGVAGGDVINLSAIDAIAATLDVNEAFAFIGTAAFTAAGQLRVVASGSDTRILGNVDDTPTADFEILVQDGDVLPTDYTAADFVL